MICYSSRYTFNLLECEVNSSLIPFKIDRSNSTTNGYAIIIEDAGANVRANRQSPNISVYYTYGGSVNKIDITSTAVV